MKSGLINIRWEKINSFSDEDISYFLFLEGKSIDVISKIRSIDNAIVQKHIINGKIKYRFLANSSNIEEFFFSVSKAGKQDKQIVLNSLDLNYKNKLIEYIRKNYVDMRAKDKEAAIWILGEIKEISCLDILTKASVHKFVNIRRMSVSAMGKIGHINSENVLMRALEDDNPQVVMYAVNSLNKIKSKKAINKIKVLYSQTEKKYIKNAIEKYIDSLSMVQE